MKYSVVKLVILATALMPLSAFSAQARVSVGALILSAPPRESAAAGRKLYGPIAAGLSKLWGVPVEYKQPINWLFYKRGMQAGAYDIIFDGPQFIDWRDQHLHTRPVIALPGKIGFYLVVHRNAKPHLTIDDFINKRVCDLRPPNLTSLMAYNYFGHRVWQPDINWVKGGMPRLYKAFATRKCWAAIFRTSYYNHVLGQAQRNIGRITYTSPTMDNQGFTVGARVSNVEATQMRAWAATPAGHQALAGLVRRFGDHYPGVKGEFVPVSAAAYTNDEQALTHNLWGW